MTSATYPETDSQRSPANWLRTHERLVLIVGLVAAVATVAIWWQGHQRASGTSGSDGTAAGGGIPTATVTDSTTATALDNLTQAISNLLANLPSAGAGSGTGPSGGTSPGGGGGGGVPPLPPQLPVDNGVPPSLIPGSVPQTQQQVSSTNQVGTNQVTPVIPVYGQRTATDIRSTRLNPAATPAPVWQTIPTLAPTPPPPISPNSLSRMRRQ